MEKNQSRNKFSNFKDYFKEEKKKESFNPKTFRAKSSNISLRFKHFRNTS